MQHKQDRSTTHRPKGLWAACGKVKEGADGLPAAHPLSLRQKLKEKRKFPPNKAGNGRDTGSLGYGRKRRNVK